MSVQAMGWVLDHYTPWVREKSEDGRERWVHDPLRAPGPVLKGASRLVLVALANHASGDELLAWPSVQTIAAEAGLSRKGAQMALRDLERVGLIREHGKRRTGTVVYQLTLGGEPGTPPWIEEAKSVPAGANTVPAEANVVRPNRKRTEKEAVRPSPSTSGPDKSGQKFDSRNPGKQNGVAAPSTCLQCDGTRFVIDLETNSARRCLCHPSFGQVPA